MSTELLSALFAVGAVVMVIYFAIMVLMIISYWIIFEKAKQPGWAILIPIYNSIIMLRLGSLHWAFVFLIFAGIIPIVGALAVFAFFGIILPIRMAKNFGQTGGFAVGLILLPIVFYPIMAFNKSIQWTGELEKEKPGVGNEFHEKEVENKEIKEGE
jgi:hypothetical protein